MRLIMTKTARHDLLARGSGKRDFEDLSGALALRRAPVRIAKHATISKAHQRTFKSVATVSSPTC